MAKFCGKCGRRLEDGEVCFCTSQTDAQKMRPESGVRQNAPQEQESYGGDSNPQAQYQRSQQYQRGQQYQSGQQYQGGQQHQGGQRYQNGQQYQGGQRYQNGQQYYNNTGNPNGPYANGQFYQGGPQQGGPDPGMYGGGPYYGGYQQGPGRSREMEWLSNKKDVLLGRTKNMFSEILPILKGPVSHVEALARTDNIAVGLEFILTKMVVCLLLLFILIFKAISMIDNSASGLAGFQVSVSNYIKIPYLQLILAVIVLTVGIDFLRALIQKGISNAFSCGLSIPASVTIIGAGAMYQALFGLVGGLIAFLLPAVGLIIVAIGFSLSPFIEYGAYISIVSGSRDRKPYAYFIAAMLSLLVTAILGSIVIGSGAMSFISSMQDLF